MDDWNTTGPGDRSGTRGGWRRLEGYGNRPPWLDDPPLPPEEEPPAPIDLDERRARTAQDAREAPPQLPGATDQPIAALDSPSAPTEESTAPVSADAFLDGLVAMLRSKIRRNG